MDFEKLLKHKDLDKKMVFVLIIGLLVCSGIFFLKPLPHKTSSYPTDFLSHYARAAGIEKDLVGLDGFVARAQDYPAYPPLFSFLTSPFAFNIQFYYLFILILFFVGFPAFLMWWSKNWFVGLAFLGSSVPFFFADGLIVYGFSALFILLFIKFKSPFFRIPLFLVSLAVHTLLFFHLGLWLIIEFLFDSKLGLGLLGVCAFNIPEAKTHEQVLEEFASRPATTSVLGKVQAHGSSYFDLFRFFLFNPLAIFGFVGLWFKDKKMLAYSCFLIFYGVVSLSGRFLTMAMLFLCIGLGYYYSFSKPFMKKLLVVATLLMVLVLFLHQLSLFKLIGFSFFTAFECAICLGGFLCN